MRAAVMLMLAFAMAPAFSDDDVSHEAAVTIWEAIDGAWNARDANRFAALFADAAMMEFYDPDQTLAGRDAIHRNFLERFPRIPPPFEHRSTVKRVRAVGNGVLAVDGTVEVLQHPADPGEGAPELFRSFRVLSILTRDDSGWRFQEMRIYPVP